MTPEAARQRAFTQAAGPDRGAMARWLESQAVVHDGEVRSWVNPEHPGFDYPEAAALWLSWVAWRRRSGQREPPGELVDAVACRLTRLLDLQGSIGRDGRLHLFDSAVAIDALVRLGVGLPERWLVGVGRFLRADAPVLPSGGARWSDGWGAHLLKAAALLARAGHRGGSVSAIALAREVRSRAAIDRCGYVHALAYGAEGELLLRSLGEPATGLDPEAVAARMARLQRPDGSLPAWTDGNGPGRADATAQAVRIWVTVDHRGFVARSRAALACLRRAQGVHGGIEYQPGTGDQNTWATLFTDQAVAWAEGGRPGRGWL